MTPKAETKERPILFSGPMVCAILDGRKTQTRRPIKPQPTLFPPENNKVQGRWRVPVANHLIAVEHLVKNGLCPYGVPGARLWVRETWCPLDYYPGEYGGRGEAGYPLKGSMKSEPPDGSYTIYYKADGDDEGPWRPSIHMPRWASRITLEVTGVRVERVQEIREEDAWAEGIDGHAPSTYHQMLRWRGSFAYLWNSINAKRGFGWDKNPWVWVVEFERVKP